MNAGNPAAAPWRPWHLTTPPSDHDLGLQADLHTLIRHAAQRRLALRWLAAGGLGAALLGCGGGSTSETTTADSGGSAGSGSGSGSGGGTTTTSCSVIPEETAGPYPGDGSNSSNGGVANALLLSGIVRSDIRSSIAGASGTASGVPLTVTLRLVNTGSSCAALEGYAIYLWHCDAAGGYSMYSSAVADENYLRGVQIADANGEVSFTTIVPGCYSGRWPHMHFEIYRSATTATSFSNKLKTSQLALPQAVCEAVYAQSAYAGSASNLGRISLSSDNIFNDGYDTQMAEVTGSVAAGYAAVLEVGISA